MRNIQLIPTVANKDNPSVQEYFNEIGNILFGKVNPSGRLNVMHRSLSRNQQQEDIEAH